MAYGPSNEYGPPPNEPGLTVDFADGWTREMGPEAEPGPDVHLLLGYRRCMILCEGEIGVALRYVRAVFLKPAQVAVCCPACVEVWKLPVGQIPERILSWQRRELANLAVDR